MTAPQEQDEFNAEEVMSDLAMRIANLEANLAMQRSANRVLRARLDAVVEKSEDQTKGD